MLTRLHTESNSGAHDDEGASAVEYGLLIALVAAVLIGAVSILGGTVANVFESVSEGIANGAGEGVEEGDQLP